MSREIKFRGKRVDNGEWVGGSLYRDYDCPECASIIPIGSLEYKNKNEFRIEAYDVDPATVGQYTGLHDKNGVEIWEGDILGLEHYVSQVVVWDDGSFKVYNISDPSVLWGVTQAHTSMRTVIGNIFDNPDLLK